MKEDGRPLMARMIADDGAEYGGSVPGLGAGKGEAHHQNRERVTGANGGLMAYAALPVTSAHAASAASSAAV